MSTLRERLHAFLNAETTIDLAQAAPLGVLAGISAAAIAAGGIAGIFGGLAVNFTSSLIDKILTATTDRERRELIRTGLQNGDGDVQRLTAGALVQAGPEVAQSLPAADRDLLFTAVEQAMQAGGPPLSAIAGRYLAALRNPAADWPALQTTLFAEAAIVRQTMEVGDQGVIRGGRQEAADVTGSVDQTARAGQGGVIENTTQSAIGVRAAAAPATQADATPEPPAFTTVRISLTPTAAGAQLAWESAAFGTAKSNFRTPFSTAELELVLTLLNWQQHPTQQLSAAQVQQLQALGLDPADPAAAQIVGYRLYTALTADPAAAAALTSARNLAIHAAAPLSLCLHMSVNATALAALPWELLWAPGETTPLLLGDGQAGSLTRHLDLDRAPITGGGRKPLRVRAIVPHADHALEARTAEQAARTAAWQPLIDAGSVTLEPDISPATRTALADALNNAGPPTVLHYVGHGMFANNEGYLVLDSATGNWDRAPISQVGPLLAGARLAVITACEGAKLAVEGSATGLLGGVAPALSAQGVPLVVGMQLRIGQSAANQATSVIYSQLAAGHSLQAAVAAARRTLYSAGSPAWYVPTLYLRTGSDAPAYV